MAYKTSIVKKGNSEFNLICCYMWIDSQKLQVPPGFIRGLLHEFICYYHCSGCKTGRFFCRLCLESGNNYTVAVYKSYLNCRYPSDSYTNAELVTSSHIDHLSDFHKLGGGVIQRERPGMVYSLIGLREGVILKHTELMQNYCQLLFIKHVDWDICAEMIIKASQSKPNSRLEYLRLVGCHDEISECGDFYDWFVGFITHCNYECVACEMMYEDGLPSIETVYSHLRECIPE